LSFGHYSSVNMLLAYRKSTPALQCASYRPLDVVTENCFAFLRQATSTTILVAVNFSKLEQQLNLPVTGSGTIQVSTYMDRTGPCQPAHLLVRSGEGVVIELD
jgi:glycosidase